MDVRPHFLPIPTANPRCSCHYCHRILIISFWKMPPMDGYHREPNFEVRSFLNHAGFKSQGIPFCREVPTSSYMRKWKTKATVYGLQLIALGDLGWDERNNCEIFISHSCVTLFSPLLCPHTLHGSLRFEASFVHLLFGGVYFSKFSIFQTSFV